VGLVVVAIRGGPASRGAEQRAVELALAGGHRLVFLHVVEESLFDLGAGVRSEAVLDELRELGEFIVAMAQERARAAGAEAATIVRVGHVLDEIVAVVKELGADVLVIGTSQQGTTPRAAPTGALASLSRRLREETSTALVVAPPGPSEEE